MKRFVIYLLAIALTVLSITSCKKRQDNQYYRVIPSNVPFLISANIQNLLEKAGVDDTQKAKLLEKIKGNINDEAFDKIKQVLMKPSESGIAIKDPIYVFMQFQEDDPVKDPIPVFVAKVNDQAKLENLLSALQKEGNGNSTEQKDGYTISIFSHTTVFAYNQDVLLISNLNGSLETIGQYADGLIRLPEENSILANKSLKEILNTEADLSYMINMEAMPSMNEVLQKLKTFGLPELLDYKQLYVLASINFENGRVHLSTKTLTNDKATEEKIQKQSPVNKQNNTFMERFPASSLLYAGSNINGEQLVALYGSMLEKIQQNIPQTIDKNLFTKIDGDLSLGVTGLSPMGIPSVLLLAQVKNDYPLENLIDLLNSGSIRFESDGEKAYAATLYPLNLRLYVGIAKNQLYFTNDADLYKNIDRKAQDPLSSTSIGRSLKNSYSCFYLNVNEIMQVPYISLACQMYPQAKIGYDILSEIEYIDSFNTEMTVSEGNVYLKNKEENSLKLIISGIQHLAEMNPYMNLH